MSTQIFKNKIPDEKFINLLDNICIKNEYRSRGWPHAQPQAASSKQQAATNIYVRPATAKGSRVPFPALEPALQRGRPKGGKQSDVYARPSSHSDVNEQGIIRLKANKV